MALDSFLVSIPVPQVPGTREKSQKKPENKRKMTMSHDIRQYFGVQHLNNNEDPEEEKPGSVIVINYMKL